MRQKQIQEEKRIDQLMFDRIKRENLQDERHKLELRKKLMDRKEMVDKQLKAQQMKNRLFAEEK